MRTCKFAPWPSFDREVIDAVNKVLRSGKVNQWTGANVYEFEKEYASYLGVKHAIAMANGSVTLDTALQVMGIGPGDEVVVSCRSFVASASCVALRGALPVFADVDPKSGNLTAETISAVLTRRTKAVIVVHLAGWPCEMDDILALCRKKKLFLIEDCAQAHGAVYRGRKVGTFGDFASFSFCQDKIFTTGGEGGLLVTNNPELWSKAWAAKDHGRDFDTVFNYKGGPGFRWMVNSFGTNYRMTEMQAVIGRIMLKRLDAMIKARRERAARLDKHFYAIAGLEVLTPPSHVKHAYYKYYVLLDPDRLSSGVSRDGVLSSLAQAGIPCAAGACPEIYLEKAFVQQRKRLGLSAQKHLPAARHLGTRSMMFLVHPTLSISCMDYTAQIMRETLKKVIC